MVDYSDFVTPTVYVKKNPPKIRVCADFLTGLNDHVMDHTYPLSSLEYIFYTLNGGKVFSKIYQKHIYK